MKIRNIGIVLSLLIVFCVCLSLIAQVTVDTSNDTPLKKAARAHRDAAHAHKEAKKISDKAETSYNRAYNLWQNANSLYQIAKSKDKDRFDRVRGSLSAALDAAGLDPVDMITDALAFVAAKIEEDVWDTVAKVSQNKAYFQEAEWKQRQKTNEIYEDWQAKLRDTQAADDKEVAAYEALLELEDVVYTFGPKDGKKTIWTDERHTSFLSLSKRWKNVKWYVKGPSETGKGTLILQQWSHSTFDDIGMAKRSEFSRNYYSGGEHVISVRAEMKNTDEIVENSYTLTVRPTGITFNQYYFMSNEKLIVTVQRDNLSGASLIIDNGVYDGGYTDTDGKVVLSTLSLGKHLNGRASAAIDVTINCRQKDGEITNHTYSITVAKPKYVSFNKTSFSSYDELVVTVTKDDLHFAKVYIDFNGDGEAQSNEWVAGKYVSSEGDGEIVLRVDFSQNREKYDHFQGYVIVNVEYDYDPNGNSAAKYHKHSEYISID